MWRHGISSKVGNRVERYLDTPLADKSGLSLNKSFLEGRVEPLLALSYGVNSSTVAVAVSLGSFIFVMVENWRKNPFTLARGDSFLPLFIPSVNFNCKDF